MDSTQHQLDAPLKVGEAPGEGADWRDHVTWIGFQNLISSQVYKQPRMNEIARFERLYNNDVPPKMRQLFNVPIPVFPGMIDTLMSDFNDEVRIKFKAYNPAQHLTVPKLQAHIDAEVESLAPNAMWNQKARWDRFNALMSGRGIMKIWSESKPNYRNVLEVVNYSDFHCQPFGGGNLENHLFAGQEGIIRTIEDIYSDESFPKEQREKLKNFGWSSEWMQQVQTSYGTKLARFRSLSQNPDSFNFIGNRTVNLCEFVVTYHGCRYYVLFEPLTRIWLRCEKWTDIVPSGLFPWVSWGTHEDQKVFWSKGYSDDIYYIADAIITLFNQELTNREKKNFNARAYDEEMFTDVQALDDAQYRPDALVPVSGVGIKRVSDGIYAFETPELSGTVDLISFMSQYTGQQTGVSDVSQGEVEASKKPTVVLAQQQQIGKRTKLRSVAYQEAYAQLGLRFVEGVRENMPVKISVQILGEFGFIEEQEMKRIEVRRSGNVGVGVTSRSDQESADNIKRQGRMNAIDIIAKNPDMSRYEKEVVLRDIGQYSEDEISFFMDDQAYESKKQIANASQAISDMLMRKMPEIYYGAEVSYLEYIENYMIDHKQQLKGREQLFEAHLREIYPIVITNMKRKAEQKIFEMQMKNFEAPTDPAAQAGGGNNMNVGTGGATAGNTLKSNGQIERPKIMDEMMPINQA